MFKKALYFVFIISLCSNFLQADKLSEIKKNGYIKVGVKYDFKPFGFIDDNGKLAGFEIDLIRLIADKLNVGIKFYQVTSQSRIPMLLENKIDLIAASMTHKLKRDELIDFSSSYFFDGQTILTNIDANEKNYLDFSDKRVGAIKGSTSGENFIKLVPDAKVIYFSEYPQAVHALKVGNIKAITTDFTWCNVQVKDSNGKFKLIGDILSYEPYAMGLPQNDSKFRDMINRKLQEIVVEGNYEELYIKWFGIKAKKLPEVLPK